MRLLLVVGGTIGCDAAADMCKVRSCVCAAEVRHLGEIFYRGGLHKVVLRTAYGAGQGLVPQVLQWQSAGEGRQQTFFLLVCAVRQSTSQGETEAVKARQAKTGAVTQQLLKSFELCSCTHVNNTPKFNFFVISVSLLLPYRIAVHNCFPLSNSCGL